MSLPCQPIIRTPLLKQRLCLRRARLLEDFLLGPLRSVACPLVCKEGHSSVQSPFEVTCPLPTRLHGDEGHRLRVRHVSKAARKAVPASIHHYLHWPLQYVLVCAGRNTNHRHSTIVCMRTSTLSRSGISSAVGARPFRGSTTVLAGLPTKPMPSSSRRGRSKALTLLAVTPIRPRYILFMYIKASTPSPSNSSLKRFSPSQNAR